MCTMDARLLSEVLLTAEAQMDKLDEGGSVALLALRGDPARPELEHLLQLPGRAEDLLRQLLGIGVRARQDVLGLVLVVPTGSASDVEERAVLMVLRDGCTRVVARRGGHGPRPVDRIPGEVPDHDEVTALVMQLLAATDGSRVSRHAASRGLCA